MPLSNPASALRPLTRRPGFTIVAVLLLALGSGANAAVFAVVRSVLLTPLPYPSPDRLVAVWPGQFVSNEDLSYWRDHARSLEGVAGLAPGWMMGLITGEGEPVKVTGARTSDNLFSTLGARAALGRTIEPGDGSPGRHHVAVLSDRLWRGRFGAEPGIIGRSVQIDQEVHTIVGVMAPGFEVFAGGTDVWVPLEWTPGEGPWRTNFSLAVARLASHTTAAEASRELQALAPAMRHDLGKTNSWGRTLGVDTLQHAITGDVRPALLILMGAVGLTLLLAAANLGTLVLGRSIERMREVAVRTALGASRTRLVGQTLAEQGVLGVLGAAAGLALARAVLPGLVRWLPSDMPRAGQVTMDGTVIIATLAATITVAILVALVPALAEGRSSLEPLLRQARLSATPGRSRMLSGLVVVQIALAVVLGAGSLLMLRSLWNLVHQDPGFEPARVLTFRLQTTSKYRALSTGLPYLQRIEDRVRALPEVAEVGAAAHLPLGGYSWTIPVNRADRPPAAGDQPPLVGWRFIAWDYFDAMGIPLRYGRPFDTGDVMDGQGVAIINETLARQLFGRADAAVGEVLVQHGGGRPGQQLVTVVGVSGDVRHLGLGRPPVPEFYRPLAQTFMFPMAFVVRTTGPPSRLAAAVRQAAFEEDPVVAVAELQTYEALMASSLARPRLLGFVLSLFAATGLGLAAVGLYGVIAYRVRQREREIGVRLALGASPAWMRRHILLEGLAQSTIGLAIGIPSALALSTLLASEVYGVRPRDPLSVTALAGAIVLVTVVACYLPARRASRIDPVVALRSD